MAKVSFIGLGVMGFPMAGHLAAAGHDVAVFNRTRETAEAWAARYGGTAVATPSAAARGREIVFCCVGNDDDLRAVTTGEDGAFAGMERGAVFVDHTTASAEVARELDADAERGGFAFVDAPVSGGQAGAENGKLSVMCGGGEDAFRRAHPFIATYAKACRLMGPAGSGQLTKMVNQLCIAGVVQGLSEALRFAQNAGLEPGAVIDVIAKGAAQSWQMENRWQTMVAGEFEHGFAINWMRKDLAICLAEARRNGSVLPLAALVDQFYAELQASGGGRWDTSALIERLPSTR